MKARRVLNQSALITHSFTVAAVSALLAQSAQAANGTWNTNADGTWSTSVATSPPWTGSIVASGSGFTADFSTVNISVTRTVTLGEAMIIGNMTFGDTGTPTFGAGWIVSDGGNPANILTLSGSAPTLTVANLSGASATISAGVMGSNGLTKNGTGNAILSGATTLSGGVNVLAGALTISGATNVSGDINVSAGGSLTFSGPSGGVTAGPIFNAGNLSVGTAIALSGASPLVQRGVSASTSLSGDKSAFSGALTINGGYLNATNTANTDVLQALGTGVVTFGASSTMRLFANSSTGGPSGTTAATAIVIGNDVVVAGPVGSTSTIMGWRSSGSGSNKIFEFDALTIGGGQTLATLGRDGYGIRFTGATTLSGNAVFNQVSANLTLAGAVNDGSSAFGLAKTGTGTLFLTGTNNYDGATKIFSGILEATDGTSLPTTSNLVLDGGVLQGTTAITFNRSLGTGAGQVQFGLAGGGFAARGAALTVNIGGGGSTLVWGSTANFLGTGAALILGSGTANNTVDFQNGINLNGAARTITANGTGGTQRISGIISDPVTGGSLVKDGAGTLRLSGSNTYTGTTNVNAGTLMVEANTGSLNSASDLTFSNTGIFNYDNTSAAGSRSQSLDALTFSKGDGTVQSTRTVTHNVSLSFASMTRSAGSTANFVVSGGTNGSTNKIILGGVTPNSLMDRSYFFGGSNYAFYDSGSFVRGINWGGDAGTTTQAGGATVATSTYARTTDSVTAQQAATFTGLNIANATNTVKDFTLNAGVTVTTNGILVAGGTGATASTTLSGGTGIQAGSGAELVIRTDATNDRLTISTPILANGSNALIKTGAGSLTLRAANTYTGTTYVNAGTLALSGLVPASTTMIAGNVEINGGTLTNNIANATNAIAATSSLVLNAGTYQQSRPDSAGNTNQTLASFTQNGGNTTLASAGSAQSLMTVTGTTTLNGGNWTVGTGGQNGSSWTTAAMKITGGVNTIGVGGNNAGTTQLTVTGGMEIVQTASGPFTALTISNASSGSATSVTPQMLISGGGLTYTPNANNPYATTIASSNTVQGNTMPIIRLAGTQTFNIGGHTGSSTPDLIIQPGITEGGINKTGLGVLVLEGASTYAGATTVTAGTLLVNGSLGASSAVTVSGGTLGGTGTVGGITTIASGGTFAPGNSIGTMNFSQTLSLAGISNFEIDPTLGLGLNADLANVTGSVTYGGVLNVTYGGLVSNFASGMLFNLFDATSFTGTFDTVNLPTLTGGLSWQNDLATNGSITVVPEPNAALLVGGLGMLALLRRRRA